MLLCMIGLVYFPLFRFTHDARTSLCSGCWLVGVFVVVVFFFVGAGRKRKTVRFWTPWADRRPPLSNRAWVQARSTRSNWRWWRTTNVDRQPPRMSSQVSLHIYTGWFVFLFYNSILYVFKKRKALTINHTEQTLTSIFMVLLFKHVHI